jgi:hypothetical protein
MKFQTLTGLVVSSLCFIAAAGAQPSARVAPHLVLTWTDSYGLLPRGFDRVARDIESVFGEMGIRVSWNDGTGGRIDGVQVQLLLRATDPTRWRLPKETMGVVIGNEIPRGTAFIFFPNVLHALGYKPVVQEHMRPPKEVARIARGLARVVTHEIVHAIVPEHGHDSRGLLASELNHDALIARQLDLDSRTRDLLIARLIDPKDPVEVMRLAR